jgi:outer membrane lipoprotein-sorting protein
VTGETAGLVRKIRERTRRVTSFVADYRASLGFQLVRLEVVGRIYYASPDRTRAETRIADEDIVTIRRGRSVQRYIPKRNETWKYSFDDLPQTEPINFGIADVCDPFFAIDESGLEYHGTTELEESSTWEFSAEVKNWARQGLLDTRKGFSIRYEPKSPRIRITLHVDHESGLLRRLTGVDKTGAELFQANYFVREMNVPMDDSLFVMDESTASYKVIDIAETLLSSLNPDAADSPSSLN